MVDKGEKWQPSFGEAYGVAKIAGDFIQATRAESPLNYQLIAYDGRILDSRIDSTGIDPEVFGLSVLAIFEKSTAAAKSILGARAELILIGAESSTVMISGSGSVLFVAMADGKNKIDYSFFDRVGPDGQTII